MADIPSQIQPQNYDALNQDENSALSSTDGLHRVIGESPRIESQAPLLNDDKIVSTTEVETTVVSESGEVIREVTTTETHQITLLKPVEIEVDDQEQFKETKVENDDFTSLLVDLKNKESGIVMLELNDADLTIEDFIALASALEFNTTLEQLHLQGNEIPDEAMLALARVIRANCTLREITIGAQKHQLRYDVEQELASSIISNQTLCIFIFMFRHSALQLEVEAALARNTALFRKKKTKTIFVAETTNVTTVKKDRRILKPGEDPISLSDTGDELSGEVSNIESKEGVELLNYLSANFDNDGKIAGLSQMKDSTSSSIFHEPNGNDASGVKVEGMINASAGLDVIDEGLNDQMNLPTCDEVNPLIQDFSSTSQSLHMKQTQQKTIFIENEEISGPNGHESFSLKIGSTSGVQTVISENVDSDKEFDIIKEDRVELKDSTDAREEISGIEFLESTELSGEQSKTENISETTFSGISFESYQSRDITSVNDSEFVQSPVGQADSAGQNTERQSVKDLKKIFEAAAKSGFPTTGHPNQKISPSSPYFLPRSPKAVPITFELDETDPNVSKSIEQSFVAQDNNGSHHGEFITPPYSPSIAVKPVFANAPAQMKVFQTAPSSTMVSEKETFTLEAPSNTGVPNDSKLLNLPNLVSEQNFHKKNDEFTAESEDIDQEESRMALTVESDDVVTAISDLMADSIHIDCDRSENTSAVADDLLVNEPTSSGETSLDEGHIKATTTVTGQVAVDTDAQALLGNTQTLIRDDSCAAIQTLQPESSMILASGMPQSVPRET
ncbi:hypothetical protein HDU84_006343, partial [Entophlyctis sp. JEL0112]